jgi:apolipoprotein N-acyltransferase
VSRWRALGRYAGVVAVAGFLLAVAFPRTDWALTPWLAIAPLLVVAVLTPPRAAFWWGLLYGGVFFLLLLRWLNFTFRVYSTIPGPLVFLPTVLLAGYCAFWIAAVAWAVSRAARRWSIAPALWLAPFFWVAGEWLRGHLFGGFPWGTVAYSQYLNLRVIQMAELTGVHGVSFLILAVNAALAGCLVLTWRRALAGVAVAAVLTGAAVSFGVARLNERAPAPPPTVRITIMQPSIEQPLKWEPRHTRETLSIYFALTRQAAAERTQLIVWPETAAPTILRQDPGLVAALTNVASELNVPLLIGSIDAAGNPPRYRNTAFLLTDRGIVGRYDKIHLVPFGEFVPLSGVIGFVRSWAEFVSELEPGTRTVVFQGPPAPYGVVICYEGIFPDLVRNFVRDGARLMVNMTNDAWFGRTSGPEQHLGMYPFRAVEHRVAVVRAANTGVSAFIAPNGQIVRRMNLFERGLITESVPLRVGKTLFTRLGDWPGLVALAVSAAALGLTRRRRGAPEAA